MSNETEVKTLTLKPFEWVVPHQSAVNVHQFEYTDEDSDENIAYNVTLLLWLGSGDDVMPVTMETEIYEECEHIAAYMGVQLAAKLSSVVYDAITVFGIDGDEIDELSADKIIADFDCGETNIEGNE